MTNLEPCAYAAGLAGRAGSLLDDASLHAWMVHRLMIDLGLDHARAAEIVDAELEHERAIARGRRPRARSIVLALISAYLGIA
jgi:hypothetical protein